MKNSVGGVPNTCVTLFHWSISDRVKGQRHTAEQTCRVAQAASLPNLLTDIGNWRGQEAALHPGQYFSRRWGSEYTFPDCIYNPNPPNETLQALAKHQKRALLQFAVLLVLRNDHVCSANTLKCADINDHILSGSGTD